MASKEQEGKRPLLAHPTAPFYVLLSGMGVLIFMGLLMVLSASGVRSYANSGSSFIILFRQLIWFSAGLCLGYVAFKMPTKGWRKISPILLISSAAMLALVFVDGIGLEINGNRNWIHLGPITIQPSEFSKIALIIWGAFILAKVERGEFLRNQGTGALITGFGFIAILILAGKDIGTVMVLTLILLGMLFISGERIPKLLLIGGICLAAIIALALLRPTLLLRLTAFLDPFSAAHYRGLGWQPAHSRMALATGGIFGVGLGGSRQKWGNLGPEAHTDFIFAVIGEEIGLLGTTIVLAAFFMIAWAGIKVAISTRDAFSRYAVAGVTIWIIAQASINIGSVTGVFPVVGLPLPLVSYGGSALISSMVGLAFILGVARREPEAKRYFDARPKILEWRKQ
ncbi:MAG: cell division protein FtsW [Actinobacteria bacterium]|nr:cell division protein FtsW [Actinomycetota bacterium]